MNLSQNFFMEFINTEVPVSGLPAVEKTTLTKISVNYLKIERIEWSVTAVILALIVAILIYFIPDFRSVIFLSITIAIYLLLVIFYRLSIERSFPWRGYSIREHDIIYQRGWIIRSIKSVPFSRIQNCSIHAGPLERKYNLSSLSVYTAGTTGADMKISGLATDEAESIREFILSRIKDEAK